MPLYFLTTDQVSDFLFTARSREDAEKEAEQHCERKRQKFYGLVEIGNPEIGNPEIGNSELLSPTRTPSIPIPIDSGVGASGESTDG